MNKIHYYQSLQNFLIDKKNQSRRALLLHWLAALSLLGINLFFIESQNLLTTSSIIISALTLIIVIIRQSDIQLPQKTSLSSVAKNNMSQSEYHDQLSLCSNTEILQEMEKINHSLISKNSTDTSILYLLIILFTFNIITTCISYLSY